MIKAFWEYLFLGIFCAVGVYPLSAQEVNATVKVNSSAVQVANRQLFVSLENALHTFINGRRWTEAHYGESERIKCSFNLIVTEMLPSGSFRGELYVQSHRTVLNSNRYSPLLNLRDRQFEFDYREYQPLDFDPTFIQGNLTAVIAWYVYLIIGLDLDSRSSLGGTACFRQMEVIATGVQSYGWSGWETSGNNRSRYIMAAAFNDGSQSKYRQMWYDYHSGGLDRMAGDIREGQEKIASSLVLIPLLYKQRPESVLILLFGDAKLHELVDIFSETDLQMKQQVYSVMNEVYPTHRVELNKLR
ncbi:MULTISPECIES: DUF4835 family protein [unclassified Proteiniphilum]|uniref:type IX secretion system protein PorD n=1 Tax=unclassified Proteiniphilum TaxID=2622718 RepID=UPI002579A985|nr:MULTISPECIES: DUF4835 family protein [unclassified Proteiniphilum]